MSLTSSQPDLRMLEIIRPYLKNQQAGLRPDQLTVLPLLAYDDTVKEANQLIQSVVPYPQGVYGFWDLFELIHSYMLYGDKLDWKSKRFIEEVFGRELVAEGRLNTTTFSLGNVNHPLSTTALSIVGGEQFGVPNTANRAYEKLEQFVDIWSKVGSFSEFNSPTYQAVNFVALATIVMYSQNNRAVCIAKILEERLWLETLALYHSPSWTLAGPHSRAYYNDSIGGSSDVQYHIRRVLGDQVPLWMHLVESYTSIGFRLHWFGRAATLAYSVPDYLLQIANQPSYPYVVQSTTRSTGLENDLTTYMGEDYCLGSASGPYCAGNQGENPIAHWRIRRPVSKHEDIRSLYVRYLLGEHQPPSGTPDAPSQDMYFPNMGHNYVYQHHNKMLVFGMPLASATMTEPATSLSLGAYIPLFEQIDEVWIGNTKVTDLPAIIPANEAVLIKDGLVYAAIKPLERRVYAQQQNVVLKTYGDNLVISMPNYQGESRSFSVDDVGATYATFCLQINSAAEYASFSDFQAEVAAWNYELRQLPTNEYRLVWTNSDGEMVMLFDPINRKVKQRTLNGKQLDVPMFSCPYAKEGVEKEISLADAKLLSQAGIKTSLFAAPDEETYVAVNLTCMSSFMQLNTPMFQVSVERLTMGKIELLKGSTLNIEAVSVDGELSIVPIKKDVRIMVNGEDITSMVHLAGGKYQLH